MRNSIEVEINGQLFRIPEMTPQKGCHWAKRLLGMGITGDLDKVFDMPYEDFRQLQADFLFGAVHIRESGGQSILNPDGSLQDGDITGPELLELTTAALAHSMLPFFDKALGDRIGKRLAPLFPKAGPTTSSIPPSEQGSGDSAKPSTEPTL